MMTKRELLNFNRELRPQGKKCCTTCNEVKPLKEFVTGGKLKSGEMNYKLCRVCNSKRGIQFNKENPNVNKEWREKNKEHVEKQRILYYQKNRDKINQRAALTSDKKRVICGCGGTYKDTPSEKTRHLSSQKHQKFEQK